jgi:FkbM family methyltransferase
LSKGYKEIEMQTGMFSVLTTLGTRSDVAVVGGGIAVLLGLVGFSLLLASAWQSLPEQRRTRHRLHVVSSALLVAIGGFAVLRIGIIQPLANLKARYKSDFRVQSAWARKAVAQKQADHANIQRIVRATNDQAAAGVIGERSKTPPPIQENPKVDLNSYLLDRDVFFQGLPAGYVQNRRIEDQAKLLETYKKDPEAFLKRYGFEYDERMFLFDAVIDAKNMVRVGRSGDGGKWVSDPQSLRTGTVVYSFGASTEISFDAEMAGLYGCEVHCFDPSPSVVRSFAKCRPGQPVGKGTFSFHSVGLGPVSLDPGKADELVLENQKCKVKRLSEIAAELGHRHVDIVKMDIEGGEMSALTEIITSGTLESLSVKQLLVEFHLWDDGHWGSFVKIINLLRERGYLIFRKEFNPYVPARCGEFCFLGPQ